MRPEVFVKLVAEAYRNNAGIFERKLNAEDLTPPNASDLEKSLYLFYVIQLDYATKSQKLYKGAKRLFEANRPFFTPEYIASLPEERLKEQIEEYLKPRYINEAIRRYKINSKFLLEEYGGDPRDIFEKSNTAQETLGKVRKFRGFGPKIANFFIRTMVNTFGFSYPDVENILPPVDVHDVRIAYLMGFIESKEMIAKNINEVKNCWSIACKEAKESWLEFDKALWLIGSEGKPKTKQDIFKLIKVDIKNRASMRNT